MKRESNLSLQREMIQILLGHAKRKVRSYYDMEEVTSFPKKKRKKPKKQLCYMFPVVGTGKCSFDWHNKIVKIQSLLAFVSSHTSLDT